MGFAHRSFEQDGHRLNEISDTGSGFRIIVNNLGAELVSIARHPGTAEQVSYLHRDGNLSGSGNGWLNHATVMGYYLHRLLGEKSSYEGEKITGGNHGFLRHTVFQDPEVSIGDRATLTYALSAHNIKPSDYPRKVSFQISYSLFGNSLQVSFLFKNEELERPAHVSFGLHPGFAVSSLENARIILPRGSYRRYLAPGNFLSGETIAFEADGGTWPVKPFELPDSFLLEAVDVDHSVVVLRDYSAGKQTEIDLSEAPYFTIWSDLNPFVCIEPCWGLPDHKEQRPFEKKLGIQVIEPAGMLKRGFSMRFS